MVGAELSLMRYLLFLFLMLPSRPLLAQESGKSIDIIGRWEACFTLDP